VGGLVTSVGHPIVENSCIVRLPVAEMASEKLMVQLPLQAGRTKQRRVLTTRAPFVMETSAMLVGGKGGVGKSCLNKKALVGQMIVERRVRSCSAKPDAKVERMETAAMRINFIIGRK